MVVSVVQTFQNIGIFTASGGLIFQVATRILGFFLSFKKGGSNEVLSVFFPLFEKSRGHYLVPCLTALNNTGWDLNLKPGM